MERAVEVTYEKRKYTTSKIYYGNIRTSEIQKYMSEKMQI